MGVHSELNTVCCEDGGVCHDKIEIGVAIVECARYLVGRIVVVGHADVRAEFGGGSELLATLRLGHGKQRRGGHVRGTSLPERRRYLTLFLLWAPTTEIRCLPTSAGKHNPPCRR